MDARVLDHVRLEEDKRRRVRDQNCAVDAVDTVFAVLKLRRARRVDVDANAARPVVLHRVRVDAAVVGRVHLAPQRVRRRRNGRAIKVERVAFPNEQSKKKRKKR